MGSLVFTLRNAAGVLRRRPFFSLMTVGTLALGIAANTTIFSLVEATVLRKPPYPQPGRLVVLREVGTRGQEMSTSWPTFRDWKRSGLFAAAGAYQGQLTSVLGGDRPRRVLGQGVSQGFFAALGVRPMLGRLPLPSEHATTPVAVVSHRFWRDALGGGPIAPRKLEIEGFSFAVVGVMPPAFDFPRGTQVWAPVELFGEPPAYRSAHSFHVVARLAPGLTVEQAEERLSALTARVAHTGIDPADVSDEYLPVGARVRTLQADRALPVRQALLLLLGAAGFVLLVACLNLASSFLARGLERQRELAVRTALGATRRRLLGQLLAESALLALLGAAAGVGLATSAGRALLAVAPRGITVAGVEVGAAVGGYTLLAAVVAVLLSGLLPALLVTRTPAAELRGGRGEGISPMQRRTWGALMGLQAGLALLLLAGAGLLLRSFVSLLAVSPGFEAARVTTLAMAPPATRYPDRAAVTEFQDRLLSAVEALSAVAAAGFASDVPLGQFDQGGLMKAEPDVPASASYRVVSGGYFRALAIPLLAGRLFDRRDRAGAPHAAIVDRASAELFWPGQDPLGKRLSSEGMDEWGGVAGFPREWATVVGVVGNVRQSDLASSPRPCVYFAITQRPVAGATLVVRSRSTPAAIFPQLEEALARVAPDVPGETMALSDVLASTLAQRRFALLLLLLFAGLAVGLAAVGIYGVVAYAVVRRTRELGVRLALGAAPRQARNLVLRASLVPVAVGALGGLAGAAGLGRALGALLFDVRPWDPLTWLAAILTLLAAAALAAWVPARRAARLDPVRSLHAE